MIGTVVTDIYHYAFKSIAHTELPCKPCTAVTTVSQCRSISGTQNSLWWGLLIIRGGCTYVELGAYMGSLHLPLNFVMKLKQC